MTIRRMGPMLREALNAARADQAFVHPTEGLMVGEIKTEETRARITEAPETSYVKEAERLAYETTRYLENAPAGSPGVAQARATLALAASVDAMREMLADRLDQIGAALVEPHD
jgi:hypothetical protein